jgi:hypothetical protein
MPIDDSTELIRVCASILDDGEVSEDEAYRLDEWLNEHRSIAESSLGIAPQTADWRLASYA